MRKGFLLGLILSVSACAATLGLTACSVSVLDPESLESGQVSAAALALTTGTSFGECLGWCRSELRVDSSSLILVEVSQGLAQPLDTRIRTLPLTPAEWSRVRTLVSVPALQRLAGVHGCPDCADGGAEWIGIGSGSGTVRVIFEYGSPPAALAALRAELSALRARFPR